MDFWTYLTTSLWDVAMSLVSRNSHTETSLVPNRRKASARLKPIVDDLEKVIISKTIHYSSNPIPVAQVSPVLLGFPVLPNRAAKKKVMCKVKTFQFNTIKMY